MDILFFVCLFFLQTERMKDQVRIVLFVSEDEDLFFCIANGKYLLWYGASLPPQVYLLLI